MPVGIQVFGPDGGIVLDTNYAITRIIGTIQVAAGSSGAIQDNLLTSGRGWYYVFTKGTWGLSNVPIVSFNPSTGVMSWSYPTNGTRYHADAFIIYGTY